MGAIVQTQQQNKQHTGHFLLVGLLLAFPIPAIMGLGILGVKKALDFHDVTFRVIIGLTGLWALTFFLQSPLLAYYISIVPLWQAASHSGFNGLLKTLEQLFNNSHIVKAYLLGSVLSLWGLLLALKLMDDNLKAPAKIEEKREKIQGDEPGGVFLGDLGRKGSTKKCYLSPAELNKHVALVGTTGSGKTTTLYNFIDYALKAKQALIIIDGKGDHELAAKIRVMSKAAQRPFYLFSTTDHENTLAYNPFITGNATEMADKLMSLTDWSEEHYKLSAQRYLQLLFRAFAIKKIIPDLATITKYADKRQLIELLSENNQPPKIKADKLDLDSFSTPIFNPETKEILDALDNIDIKAIGGLSSRIGILAEGSLRQLFKSASKGVLSLFTAIEEKGVILFSLDSLTYPEQARLLGRLIIADIKTQISYHARHRSGQKVSLIFDEFNVFASGNVVDLVNKSRSAGFEAVLAFQSLADIDRLEHGAEIRRQIIQNCNTLIVQRQNDPSDAEELARAIGTKDDFQMTYQTSTDGITGLGSARAVKEFKVHPDVIKELKTGEAYVKRHTSKGMSIKKVWIKALKT